MSQTKKNLMYNICYHFFTLILPIVTVPYVSRVIGADGIGIYSYTYSIVYYFIIISMLGITNYGNRTIAKVRDNKEELSKNFCSIYSLQLIMTFFMIICYLIYICLFLNQYKLIAIVQIIYLFSTMFDINWFFFGLEKFKLTVSRSILIKIISLILIFIFVNDNNDVWIYTLILSLSSLLGNLLLFPFLIKEVSLVKVKFKNIKKHIKPCLILFLPVVAVSLYKVMDKIMLGLLSTITEVGYYEQSEKIINIPIGLVTALGTVMLPKISNLVAKGENVIISDYIRKSSQFMMFMAFPICFGLIAISSDFIPLFLGNEFTKSSILLQYLSLTIIFISFANVIRTQYLIPKEKDKIFVFSVFLGAIFNFIMNMIFIPKYQSIGACYGTIVAEFVVMIYQIIAVKNELDVKNYIRSCWPFFIKSLIMFIFVFLFKYIKINIVIKLCLQILFGILIYFLLNVKYIFSVVNIDKLLKRKEKKL